MSSQPPTVLIIEPSNVPGRHSLDRPDCFYGKMLIEYWWSCHLTKQIEQLSLENEQLRKRLDDVERRQAPSQAQAKQHHTRRPFSEIEKNYLCMEQGCLKKYASKASLKLHKKIKHQKENEQVTEAE